jgi:hypothetical protein
MAIERFCEDGFGVRVGGLTEYGSGRRFNRFFPAATSVKACSIDNLGPSRPRHTRLQ